MNNAKIIVKAYKIGFSAGVLSLDGTVSENDVIDDIEKLITEAQEEEVKHE